MLAATTGPYGNTNPAKTSKTPGRQRPMIRKVNSTTPSAPPSNWPVNILAAMMFLIPAAGVPNEYMLQDTLKSAIAAFGILLAALVFFWHQRERTAPLVWHPMLWLPLLLMAYALGSMMWSHAYLAGVEAIRWFLVSLLMWLLFNTVQPGNISRLLWGLHWGAFVASIWVALQFWFDFKLFPQAAPPASTFVNRNFFAEYAVSVLPISVYLLLAQPYSRWVGWIALTVAFDLVAILMTGTRSALLALAVTTPLMVLATVRYRHVMEYANWSRTQRAMIAAIALAAIAILGSIPSGNAEISVGRTPLAQGNVRSASMGAALQGKDYSFSTRLEMWKSTARMIMANPWWGVGAGAWEVEIPLYQRRNTNIEIDFYAHNDPLQLLAEYGLVLGGLAAAFFLAFVLQTGHRAFICKSPQEYKQYQLIPPIGLWSFLLVAGAGFPLHLAAGTVLFGVYFGLLCAQSPNQGTVRTSKRAWHHYIKSIGLLLTVMLIFLAAFLFQRAFSVERLAHENAAYAEVLLQHRGDPSIHSIEAVDRLVQNSDIALQLNPHYRKLHAQTGDLLYALGRKEAAARVWQTIVKSRPNITAIWTNLAVTYAELGRNSDAMNAFLEVKRLKPDLMSTRTLELTLLSLTGEHATAATAWHQYFDTGEFDQDRVRAALDAAKRMNDAALLQRALALKTR